jgi:hypothetical protein
MLDGVTVVNRAVNPLPTWANRLFELPDPALIRLPSGEPARNDGSVVAVPIKIATHTQVPGLPVTLRLAIGFPLPSAEMLMLARPAAFHTLDWSAVRPRRAERK